METTNETGSPKADANTAEVLAASAAAPETLADPGTQAQPILEPRKKTLAGFAKAWIIFWIVANLAATCAPASNLSNSSVAGIYAVVMLLSAAVVAGYFLLLYRNPFGLYLVLVANFLGVLLNGVRVGGYVITTTTGLIIGIITFFITRKQVAYPFGRPSATDGATGAALDAPAMAESPSPEDPNAASSPLPAEPSPTVEGASPADALPLSTPPAETSRLAIASLATGIGGWLILPLFGAVAAIITGHLAKKQIRQDPGRLAGTGLATAGLVLGYAQIGLAFLAVIVTSVMLIAARPESPAATAVAPAATAAPIRLAATAVATAQPVVGCTVQDGNWTGPLGFTVSGCLISDPVLTLSTMKGDQVQLYFYYLNDEIRVENDRLSYRKDRDGGQVTIEGAFTSPTEASGSWTLTKGTRIAGGTASVTQDSTGSWTASLGPPPAATAAEAIPAPTTAPAASASPRPSPTETSAPTPAPGAVAPASTNAVSAWTASLAQVTQLAQSEEEMGQDLAWAPDSRTIAVAANNLHFFAPGADREVRQVEGLQWVTSVAYSPDGKMVAWSNHDGLKLWNVASGDDIGTFDSLQDADQLAFSPDGTLLAVAQGTGQKVTVLEVATGRTLQTFPSACCAPDTVAFSPDGKTLAWGAERVYLADVASGQVVRELPDEHMGVTSVAFSPNGNLLAAAYNDNAVVLYSPADGRVLRTLTGHTGPVTRVAFSPDSRVLASASFDTAIKIWDVDSGQELRTLTGHTGWVTALGFSPDGTMLASGGNDSALRIWGPPSAAAAVSVPPPAPTPLPAAIQARLKTSLESEWAHQVAWSSNGKLLAVAAYHIGLYDAQTLKQVHVIDSVQWPNSIAFSPDDTLLAAASHDGIRIWNTANWDELRAIPGAGDAQHLAWSPDGALLAVSIQQAIKLIDPRSGEERFTLNAGSYGSNLAFTPDGRNLIGQGSGGLKMWDVATGQEVPLPSRLVKEGGNSALAFSPDGQFLATASSDKTIRLWKTQGWAYLHTLSGHTGDINALAFAPDGRRLASGSSDLAVRLWDVATGRPLNVLTGHTDRVNSVAFSPDGGLLASGATDNAVRIWSLNDGTTSSAPTPESTAAPAPTVGPTAQTASVAPTAAPTRAPTTAPTRAAIRPKPTSAAAAVCPDPRVRITYPANGATISGVTNFLGTANLPDQTYYKFEYKPADGPTWQFLTQFDGKTVVNDKLMDFFTTTIAPGVYDFRLIAVDRSGNYPPPCEIRVTVQR